MRENRRAVAFGSQFEEPDYATGERFGDMILVAPGTDSLGTRDTFCIEVAGGKMAITEPNATLVKVFDTEQESEAMVVQGLLESAGIESIMSSLDAPQDVLPVGGVVLQVRPEQAEEALRVIEENRNSAAADADLSEESAQPE
jgi:hypothetical protein